MEVRELWGGDRASGIGGCEVPISSSMHSVMSVDAGAKFANSRCDISTGGGKSSRVSKLSLSAAGELLTVLIEMLS